MYRGLIAQIADSSKYCARKVFCPDAASDGPEERNKLLILRLPQLAPVPPYTSKMKNKGCFPVSSTFFDNILAFGPDKQGNAAAYFVNNLDQHTFDQPTPWSRLIPTMSANKVAAVGQCTTYQLPKKAKSNNLNANVSPIYYFDLSPEDSSVVLDDGSIAFPHWDQEAQDSGPKGITTPWLFASKQPGGFAGHKEDLGLPSANYLLHCPGLSKGLVWHHLRRS